MTTITWQNPANNDWTVAAAWTGGVVPTGTDDVLFSVPGMYASTIAAAENVSVNTLLLSAGIVTVGVVH